VVVVVVPVCVCLSRCEHIHLFARGDVGRRDEMLMKLGRARVELPYASLYNVGVIFFCLRVVEKASAYHRWGPPSIGTAQLHGLFLEGFSSRHTASSSAFAFHQQGWEWILQGCVIRLCTHTRARGRDPFQSADSMPSASSACHKILSMPSASGSRNRTRAAGRPIFLVTSKGAGKSS